MSERLPADFVFGLATSSYQIEGAVSEDGRRPSIWDTYCEIPGKIADGSSGAVACDHYHRYREDVHLLESIGVDAYRFSVAWPRIVPEGVGAVNEAGLDFYSRLVDGLLESGITPFVTLYHWDLPEALDQRGGWLESDTAKAFAEYASIVVRHLGDRVENWITHNEMWCASHLSYQIGMFAPGHSDWSEGLLAAHNVLVSHGHAVRAIRAEASSVRVGIAPNFLPSYPADQDSASDRRAARIYDGYFNRWFLDPLVGRGYPEDMLEIYGDLVPPVRDAEMEAIAEPVDFIGVNYYNSNWYVADPDDAPLGVRKQQPDGLSQTADRDVYSQGLYDTLTRLSRDYGFANIYVTENGAAFPDELVQESEGPRVHDSGRVRFLSDHFEQADRAVRDGVPLRGYFVWSLMDNFEWASGYTLRYGICYTDFETQERIMKDSAYWYQSYIRAHKSAGDDST